MRRFGAVLGLRGPAVPAARSRTPLLRRAGDLSVRPAACGAGGAGRRGGRADRGAGAIVAPHEGALVADLRGPGAQGAHRLVRPGPLPGTGTGPLAFVTGPVGWLFMALGGSVAQLIVYPFVVSVTVVAYFDLRIRKEAFDLAVTLSPAAPGSQGRMRRRLLVAAAIACAALLAAPAAVMGAPLWPRRAYPGAEYPLGGPSAARLQVARLDAARRLAETDAPNPCHPEDAGGCARPSASPSTSTSPAGRSTCPPTTSSPASRVPPPRTSATPTTTFRRWRMRPRPRWPPERRTPRCAWRRPCMTRSAASTPSRSLFERIRHDIWVFFLVSLWQRVTRAVDRVPPVPHGLLVVAVVAILAVVVIVVVRRLGYVVPERKAPPLRQPATARPPGSPRQGGTGSEATCRGGTGTVRGAVAALAASIVPDTPSLTAANAGRPWPGSGSPTLRG